MSHQASLFRRLSARLAAVLVISGISLLLTEGALRLYRPLSAFGGGMELLWMREYREGSGEIMTTDPELGFRPNLGNGIYSEQGTLISDWDTEPRPGTTRLLFIGDSVTQRGKIPRALREIYGTEQYEYWNAGVGSFNTIQEVGFYKRYNAAIEPDHVILFFHLNDFETTPIAFFHEGQLITFAPHRPTRSLNPWLFRNSTVYRAVIGLQTSDKRRDRGQITDEVRASIQDLSQLLAREGIRFSAVILPYFMPESAWSKKLKNQRARISQIFDELDVHHFDLFAPTQRAIKAGVDVQERPGDYWHPSDAAARRFARYLSDRGLLAEPQR